MLRVGIIGASGYTGAELARLLLTHPEVTLTLATSRQYAGQQLAAVFPHLRDRLELCCENTPLEELVDKADFFFTAVPHKTAMDMVPALLQAGKKVVDLSADYRLRKAATYEAWYEKHTSPELLEKAVYGLPELYREQVIESQLTANPGCYPTSIILGLAPLLANKLVDPTTLIADSKSGTTGAGRTAQTGSLYCEVADGFRAYKVGGAHRHIPEIEQELSLLSGQDDLTISFTPHLLPINRGILSTIYAQLLPEAADVDLQELYASFYEQEFFVRVLPQGAQPATQHVRGSNFCDIGLQKDTRTGRIIVTSAIDNLVKGASGQAVQNMNLMNGFDEQAGLQGAPFFP